MKNMRSIKLWGIQLKAAGDGFDSEFLLAEICLQFLLNITLFTSTTAALI